jgi:hypothetical protein
MNLLEIRNMIGSIIDYDPQVQSYKDEVNRIVNEIYLEMFTSQAWKFSQKAVDYYTHTDVIDTAAVINFQDLSETILSAKVTLSSDLFLGQSVANTRFGQLRREGDILKITGASDDINNGLYIIDKVNANARDIEISKYSSNSPRHFFKGTGGTTETVTVSIEERQLKLPYDCINILSVGIRNLEEAGVGTNAVGHVFALSRRDDEELGLRDDFVGTPTTWIPYDHPPATVNRVVRDFIPRSGKDFNVIDAPTAGNGWKPGTYEFCMAYELHGNVGPKSDAISVAITKRPEFTFQDTTKLGAYGLRKRIYFRIKAVEGIIGGINHEENFWRDIGAFTYSSSGATLGALIVEDTVTSYEFPYQEFWYCFNNLDGLLQVPRETVVLDNRWRIRLHPRPATQTPMRIRYMYYPGKLLDDYDSPNSPTDTHRYLVYRACEELFVKHKNPNMALYYEKKANDEMRKCEKRYLSERAQYYIKGGISGGPQRLRPFRNLTHGTGQDGI